MIRINGVMPITEKQYYELNIGDATLLICQGIPNSVVHECALHCDPVPTSELCGSIEYRKCDFRIEFSATIGE